MDRSNNPTAKRNKKIVVEKFKGLETVIDSSELGLNIADEARNVSWELDGGISKREGSSVLKIKNNDFNGISYFIKRTVSMIDRQKEGVASIIAAAKGDKITDTKLKNVKIEGMHSFLFKEDDKLKIGGVGKNYDFLDSSGNTFSLDGHVDMIGMRGYEKYAFISYNKGAGDGREIYLIDENNGVINETKLAVTNNAPSGVAHSLKYKLDNPVTIQTRSTGGGLGTTLNNTEYFLKYLRFIDYYAPFGATGSSSITSVGNYGETSGTIYIVRPGVETQPKPQINIGSPSGGTAIGGTGGIIYPGTGGGPIDGSTGAMIGTGTGGGGGVPPLYPQQQRRSTRQAYVPNPGTGGTIGGTINPDAQITISGISGGFSPEGPGEKTYAYDNDWYVTFLKIKGNELTLNYLYNYNIGDTPTVGTIVNQLHPIGYNGGGGSIFWGLGNTSDTGWIFSVSGKKVRINKYARGGIIQVDGNAWIDISAFRKKGEPSSEDFGRIIDGWTKTGGLAVIDYEKDGNTNKIKIGYAKKYEPVSSGIDKGVEYDSLEICVIEFDDSLSTGTYEITKLDNVTGERFISSKRVGVFGNLDYKNPKIYYDKLRRIYMVDGRSETGFVNNFSSGTMVIPDGKPVHTISNKGTEPLEIALYDSKFKIIGSKFVLNNGIEKKLDDNIMHNVKYIVNLNDDPRALEDIEVYGIGITTSQTLAIKNWIRNGEKVIGETIDLTCVFEDKQSNGKVQLQIYYHPTEGENKVSKIIGIGGSSSIQTAAFLDGDVLDWTYINDSIIITTEENVYTITAIKTLKPDGEVEIFCYVNTIFDMAEKITYDQALINGLNVLSKEPLKIIKDYNELQGTSNIYKDIIITDTNGDLALSVNTGEVYQVHPQFQHSDSNNGPRFDGGWKLEHYDESTNEWKEEATLIKDSVDPVTIGPFTKGGRYRISSVAKIFKISGDIHSGDDTFKKTLTFNIDNTNVNISKNKVADEIKKCKYVTTLEGRLVLYGNGTKQIYSSEVNNPFYFTASEIVVADSFGKSEDVVSINTFKDTQVIFTNTTMMSMTRRYEEKGGSFWSVLPLDGVIGAINHKGVCPVENSLSFVGYNGIYLIGQISVAEKRVQLITISEPIRDLVETDKHPENNLKKSTMKDINSANLEKRLLVSFPSKGYVMVYDYNNAENIAKGKWSMWTRMVPQYMEIFENELYFLQRKEYIEDEDGNILIGKVHNDHLRNAMKSTIFVKNKRLYTNTYEQVNNVDFYYTDFHDKETTSDGSIGLVRNIQFIYSSKESSLGEPLKYKKFKRISITTDNTYKAGTDYRVITTVDGHINWDDEIKNDAYKKPSDNQKEGFMTLGQTITNFFEKENINSISHMKSKNGLVVNIRIVEETHNPFSAKRIYIEYLTSDVKRFKYKNVKNK